MMISDDLTLQTIHLVDLVVDMVPKIANEIKLALHNYVFTFSLSTLGSLSDSEQTFVQLLFWRLYIYYLPALWSILPPWNPVDSKVGL